MLIGFPPHFFLQTNSSTIKNTNSFLTALLCTLTASFLVLSHPAQAGYIVTLEQVGSDVVATGSGALDLSGLMGPNTDFGAGTVAPSEARILIGATGFFEDFTGFSTISGPTSFGSGGGSPPFRGTGDHVGIDGLQQLLFVPQNYVSGTPLSSSATWPFQTFTSLGVTPGTYVWTWGPGANQNFTLEIKFPTPNKITDCMDNGWRMLTRADGTPFENQGRCIQYVNTGK